MKATHVHVVACDVLLDFHSGIIEARSRVLNSLFPQQRMNTCLLLE